MCSMKHWHVMPALSFIINQTNSDLLCSTAAHSPVSHQVIPIASNRQTHECISDKPEVVMGEMVASGSGSFMMEGKSLLWLLLFDLI